MQLKLGGSCWKGKDVHYLCKDPEACFSTKVSEDVMTGLRVSQRNGSLKEFGVLLEVRYEVVLG